MATTGTVQHEYNAADWTVSVAGTVIPWRHLEFTYDQFHMPASFVIDAPLQSVDTGLVLPDKPAEVIIRRKGKELFVGQVDESHIKGNQSEMPQDMLSIKGRDLSAKLVLNKSATPPQNLTASEIVKKWCADAGFTDMSGITATSDQIGDFVKHNYHQVRKGLNRHEVIFDLAEYEGFVFRVRGRRPYFGPPPGASGGPTMAKVALAYQRDFNEYDWRKSHTNADVTIKVVGRNKHGTRVSQSQGSGSILVESIERTTITPELAQKKAIWLLQRAEMGLIRMNIGNIPGRAEWSDILFEFAISGIEKRIDQAFWPERIHHVLDQDTHITDLTLYNKAAVSN